MKPAEQWIAENAPPWSNEHLTELFRQIQADALRHAAIEANSSVGHPQNFPADTLLLKLSDRLLSQANQLDPRSESKPNLKPDKPFEWICFPCNIRFSFPEGLGLPFSCPTCGTTLKHEPEPESKL